MSFNWESFPDMDAIARDFEKRMEKTVDALGDGIVRIIRDEIPPPRGAGNFPGWRATGALEAAPTRTPTQKTEGGGFETTIFMRSGGTGASGYPTDVYKKTQEYGMVIRAKKKFMIFKLEDGTTVRARKVTIRPKRYFWQAFDYMSERMGAIAATMMKG